MRFEAPEMSPPEPIVRAVDLSKAFAGPKEPVEVLRELTFTVHAGDYLAITGPSGSGKSTLLHTLGLLHRASSGHLEIFGRSSLELSRREASRLRNRRIGFVFQQSLLIPTLTVLENAALPLVYSGVSKLGRTRRAREILESLGLGHRLDHRAVSLSGGESQRTAIARALVNDPKLILADEPTGNLDSENSEKILSILDRLHEEGHSLVVVTHDPMVAGHCKQQLELIDGRIVD